MRLGRTRPQAFRHAVLRSARRAFGRRITEPAAARLSRCACAARAARGRAQPGADRRAGPSPRAAAAERAGKTAGGASAGKPPVDPVLRAEFAPLDESRVYARKPAVEEDLVDTRTGVGARPHGVDGGASAPHLCHYPPVLVARLARVLVEGEHASGAAGGRHKRLGLCVPALPRLGGIHEREPVPRVRVCDRVAVDDAVDGGKGVPPAPCVRVAAGALGAPAAAGASSPARIGRGSRGYLLQPASLSMSFFPTLA